MPTHWRRNRVDSRIFFNSYTLRGLFWTLPSSRLPQQCSLSKRALGTRPGSGLPGTRGSRVAPVIGCPSTYSFMWLHGLSETCLQPDATRLAASGCAGLPYPPSGSPAA